MAVVRVMKMAIDQVINMVPMRHSFMSTVRSMNMILQMTGALVLRRAVLGVGRCYTNDMFIDVVPMGMVQMTLVQIVDMVIMHNACMFALRAV